VADIADDDGCESIEGEDRMPLLRVSIAGSEASIEMGECRAQVLCSGQILCADGLHNLILLCVSMRIYAFVVGVNECAKSTVHHISTRKFYDKQGWLGFILISVHFIVCACLRNFAHVPAFYGEHVMVHLPCSRLVIWP
jgi:hypothetical protein